MRYVTCNLCGADDHAVVLVGSDLLHDIPGQHTLVRCNVCGLMYLNPQPTEIELETYYPDDYEAHAGTKRQELNWIRRIDYRYGIEKRYRAIMRYFRSAGRMLDIGCGPGTFLDGMREHGWEVEGVEPNARAASYAAQELGLRIRNTTFEKAELAPDRFDLVTMWNVLEHLSDPQNALARIREALAPGGLVVFAVPSTESYDLRLFGKYWAGYDVPRHLFVFPPETLEVMVRRAGLEVLERRCIYGTYHALAYSAQFALKDAIRKETVRMALKRILLSLPLRATMMPLTRIIDLLDRGTIMTWFCRRMESDAQGDKNT